MPKGSGGGSKSGSGTVSVGGYTRSNGTQVAGYTRSAPSSSSSSSSSNSSSSSSSSGYSSSRSTGSSSSGVSVSGYTRANGTYVGGYTRSTPGQSTSSSSAGAGKSGTSSSPASTSSSGSGTIQVSGHTRANGTYVHPHTRSAPSSKLTSSSSEQVPTSSSHSIKTSGPTTATGNAVPIAKYYADNAANRKHGRVGKPLGSQVVHSSPSPSSSPASTSSTTPSKTYVDNASNRKHGRVGKPLGSHKVHNDGSSTVEGTRYTMGGQKCYKDTPSNRQKGRANEPIPPRRKLVEDTIATFTLDEVEQLFQLPSIADSGYDEDEDRQVQLYALDQMRRDEVEERWSWSGIQPATDVSALRLLRPSVDQCNVIMIPYNELEVDYKLPVGKGAFGEVFAGLWKGTPIAYKRLYRDMLPKKKMKSFETEVAVLSGLEHPSIVKMFGIVEEEGKLGIVMEYMTQSLYRAIFIEGTEFLAADKKRMIQQVANALDYLHCGVEGKTIAHGDIKTENILLDGANNAKLGDFGLSKMKNDTASSQSAHAMAKPTAEQGTPRYSPPEVLRGDVLGLEQQLKADVYSLAVVIFEVLTEEKPFDGLNTRQIEKKVCEKNARPTAPTVPLSSDVGKFLDVCWNKDPVKRPTATQLKQEWERISAPVV